MSSAETVSDENTESFARPLLNRHDNSAEMNKIKLEPFVQVEYNLQVPFAQYYKNKYGSMPKQNRGQTYVKDYLRKFSEYRKSGHLDLSFEDGGILFAKANSGDMIDIRNDIDLDTRREAKVVRAQKNFNPMIKREPDWTYKVVFVRHGQSIWNKAGRFSGWIDVPLNDVGVQEAKQAG